MGATDSFGHGTREHVAESTENYVKCCGTVEAGGDKCCGTVEAGIDKCCGMEP